MESVDIFMARQPIYDAAQNLFAYELLYRSGMQNSAGNVGAAESAKSLVNSLVDIGLHKLVGSNRAFINLSEDLLLSDAAMLLPPDKVVLEILETVEKPECLDAVARLFDKGYAIALDDFVPTPTTEKLLKYAKYIKFDIMGLDQGELIKRVSKVRRPGVTLLAERVETKAEVDFCKRLGFQLFQGYFYAKPEIVKGSSIPPNKMSMLQLAAKLQSPDIDLDELEELISADVSLTYRLLRLVKSAHIGVPAKVASVRQSLMFLGVKTVASLASLLAMSACSAKPQELVVTAFLRAKMCETLAQINHAAKRDRYFTVGLLSVIDALLDAPMEDVLAQLPLSPEVNEALLNTSGFDNELAEALRLVLMFEKGDWDGLSEVDISGQKLMAAYTEAVDWASEKGLALAAA